MMFDLQNRVCLVTGAAGHLGYEMTLGLGECGAHVILCGLNEKKLTTAAHQLSQQGIECSVCVMDVRDSAAQDEAVRFVKNKFGRLDVLINNAYAGRAVPMEMSAKEDFDSAFEIAVTSSFALVQKFEELMCAAVEKCGYSSSVINIASMYGVVSPDPRIYGDSGKNSPPFYGPAKAGLIQLTRYLACHLAPKNIRVNAISPGPFPPQDFALAHPDFHQHLCNKNPMNRIGRAAELKGPIAFLASPASSYVTGINLPVDGGWTAW